MMRRLPIIPGLLWPWPSHVDRWKWIGRRPGDIRMEREGFSFQFPIVMFILIACC